MPKLINKTSQEIGEEYENKVARYAIQDSPLPWYLRFFRWLKGIGK